MPASRIVLGTTSVLALVAAAGAAAADAERAAQPVERIVITGENVYRDRTADINPTLSYDLDFFQRFEPQTVGEMLKRTPSVVFSGDVLEYDAVQLRGLGAEYSEVLINGRRVPGQGSDRTFFVDRIPAELIERIEIVRAPSADISSEGMAGTLNIIMKDGAELEGALLRAGATYFGDDDEALRGSLAGALAGSGEGHDFWLGFNIQERRNPKEKVELYFDDADGVLTGFAFEDDTRNGVDYAINGSLGLDLGPDAEIRLNGYYVLTDRGEQEYVLIFEGDEVGDGELTDIETQVEDIDQQSYGLEGVYSSDAAGGTVEVVLGYSGFEEDTVSFETEQEPPDPPEEDESAIDLSDTNLYLSASYAADLDDAFSVKFGFDARLNDREGTQDSRIALTDVEAQIDETILAPFALATLELGPRLTIEGGLRYDNYDRKVDSEDGGASASSDEALPSANVRWDATDADRFHVSLARTIRRPGLELITPFEEDETPDDDDAVLGNPDLDSETAWGFDAGYERRLSRRGVIGVNFFYRDISNLIEITDTGEPYDGGPGTIFTPLNIGDGATWGVELDVSTPLDVIGLPETGFYANYAYMDSEVTDPFTGEDRRFRDQPEYVYNVSLAQNLPMFGAAAGLSYQKRGESLATEFDEYVTLEYDANLEAFIEKRIGDSMVVRLSGSNLLDAEKLEFIREFGEGVNEIQIEQSSPTYSVTVRAAF